MARPSDRPDYRDALASSNLLTILARFDPRVAGTLPLGIGLPESDIDILCHAPDPAAFTRHVWQACSGLKGFSMRQWSSPRRPIIASFRFAGWPFELFGEDVPVESQAGWRHFMIEQRLLALGGAGLRAAIRRRRRAGAKTEPAFAALLGLAGNPYDALLTLEDWTDDALAELIRQS